jgi:hypothetical protein
MLVVNSFAQSPMTSTKEGGKKPTGIDRKTVPTEVTDTYVREYPSTTYETWYYYPGYSDTDEEWYIYTPSYTTVTDMPGYYVVEFTSSKDNMPYTAIYSKEGKKMRTYRSIGDPLPKAVTDAFNKSTYKSWTLKKDKEEMWRDSDKKKVYKLTVERGKEKHLLYYQEDGKLLKDKDRS